MTETDDRTQVYRDVHQGDPRGDLGRDHEARVDGEVRLPGIADYDLRPGGKYEARANEG